MEVVEVSILETFVRAKNVTTHPRSRISEAEKALDSISLQLISLCINFAGRRVKTSIDS